MYTVDSIRVQIAAKQAASSGWKSFWGGIAVAVIAAVGGVVPAAYEDLFPNSDACILDKFEAVEILESRGDITPNVAAELRANALDEELSDREQFGCGG